MKKINLVRKSAFAAVALMGLAVTGSAFGDGVSIGIRIGEPVPPPRPVVTTTVVTYETYCVGPRRMLYDADWRLRTAQCDELRATEELEAARRHEGEVAVALEAQEGAVAELKRCVGGAAADAAEARIRLTALEKRTASARSDLDSARVLRDGPGIADAEKRLHDNELAAAATVEEIRRAENAAAARAKLADAEVLLGRIHADFDVAHDAVFACQNRLTDAHERVCLALHDRDDALWVMYREDIMFGRIRPEAVGFHIDLVAFGGRMPRDPEILRAHCVRDVTYWRTRPVEIQTRVVEVDRCTEVVQIREVARVHEPRYREVAAVEVNFTPEVRVKFAERINVERTRYEADRNERTLAAKEGRKPRVSETERAEAKAIVTKAQAEAKATEMKAHAEAKATEMKAHADAKATEMQAHADAKSKVMTAHADAKATEMEAHADAKSKEMTAHGDAKSKEMTAHADAKSKEMTAHGDAKAKETTAKGDAKAQVTQAHGDAKSKEIAAKGDAKSQVTQARGDAKSQEISAKGDAKSKEIAAKSSSKSDPRVDSKQTSKTSDPRDPRNRDPRASADPRSSDPRVTAASSKDSKGKNGKRDPRDQQANSAN
jgi:hypothetical protein